MSVIPAEAGIYIILTIFSCTFFYEKSTKKVANRHSSGSLNKILPTKTRTRSCAPLRHRVFWGNFVRDFPELFASVRR